MSVLDFFRGRDPTKLTNMSRGRAHNVNAVKMVTTYGNGLYLYDGKIYESDIVRACLRPKVQAIGKLDAKHVRQEEEGGITVNPEPRIRFLLEDPNPYMTGQMLLEKVTTQLMLNNNAFILIARDMNGLPEALYPITSVGAEAIYDNKANLYLRFTFANGTQTLLPYSDVIHLRRDFNDNELFGTDPASALKDLMECVGTIDRSLVNAVKNSNMIRWLLSYNTTMRPEDIKRQTKEFAENYLSYSTDSFGVAAVDQKVEAKQVQPTDYVPNAALADRVTERVYSFFNTNKDIVQSTYDEDMWNAYHQTELEPLIIQLSTEFTRKLFSRRERAAGNKIAFESANLAYASMATKLKLTDFVDRGMMNPNEVRKYMSLPSIPGGDVYVRRLDTAPVSGETPDEQIDNQQEAQEVATTTTKEGGVEDAKTGHKRGDLLKQQ